MNYLYPDYAKWQSRFAALALGAVSHYPNTLSSYIHIITKYLTTTPIGE
jgi:hypothetical protein